MNMKKKKFSFIFSENCKWSAWGAWGACSKTCGKGLQIRSRKVSNEAKYGGRRCYGSNKTRKTCHGKYCPGIKKYLKPLQSSVGTVLCDHTFKKEHYKSPNSAFLSAKVY